MKLKLVSILILVASYISCDKINYYPDNQSVNAETQIIAHMAGGNNLSQYQENSLEAAKNSLPIVDGIEVDIQISKDGTLWLSHDVELLDCGGISYKCFPKASDTEIMALDSCNGDLANYTKLEDVFSLMSSKFPKKYISIDVKAWVGCGFLDILLWEKMKLIADEIIRLKEKYSLQNKVMVECAFASFLNYVQKNSTEIECYYLTFDNFEKGVSTALENEFAGISYKYNEAINADYIKVLHKKGLKIQVWTVNTEEDILEAISIKPDFIQTDNVEHFE